jgi:hypothetical protein
MRHFFEEQIVFHQHRTARAGRDRVLVVAYRPAGCRRHLRFIVLAVITILMRHVFSYCDLGVLPQQHRMPVQAAEPANSRYVSYRTCL